MAIKTSQIFSQRNIVILLILILIATFTFYKADSVKKANAPVDITIVNDDHYTGPVNATNTLVEYGDFQCPACGAYHPIVMKIAAENSANLKFVFRHLPLINLHKNALMAAVASEAASNQGKFWELYNALYDKQKDWGDALDAKEKILGYAKEIGIDTVKMEKDMADPALVERVDRNLKEATALGLNSTPSFILNGKKIDTSNVGSFEDFSNLVKAEINKTTK